MIHSIIRAIWFCYSIGFNTSVTFILSFIHSFINSLVHQFIQSFIKLTELLIDLFMHLLIFHSFNYSDRKKGRWRVHPSSIHTFYSLSDSFLHLCLILENRAFLFFFLRIFTFILDVLSFLNRDVLFFFIQGCGASCSIRPSRRRSVKG